MNKSSVDKLSFFFMGLKSRFSENRDVFESVEVQFKAGLKTFKGIGVLNEAETISYNFNGATKLLSFSDVLADVMKEAANYEELQLSYKERGTKLVISATKKGVTMNTEELKFETKEDQKDTSTLLNRDYLIKAKDAGKLLKAIGIMSKDGKIRNDKIRKYNQIDHYVELLEKNFESMKKQGTLYIVDVGCGKSYLSFVLNYYLTEVKRMKCHFIGIDISEQVIEASRQIQKELGYRNMEFHAMDVKDFKDERKIDAVLSLHACDTATDMALAFGVYKEADFIVAVPCCHKEMLKTYSYEPFEGIMKHGILKARLADTLTDGLRGLMLEEHGYDVSIVEYISPLETPKNLMIRAYRTGRPNEVSKENADHLISEFGIYPAFRYYLDQYTYGLSDGLDDLL
ncbi:MAG TPA: SAM-dependent methyltransferase [Clostridiaceae bacterium]|nr:SAM-dependent methyltransferase [Clostridiaceae bacterium]